VLIVLPYSPYAQNSYDYTLNECFNHALSNSAELKKEKINNDILSIDNKIDNADKLPQIHSYLSYFNLFEVPTYIFPAPEGRILSGNTGDDPFPVRLGQTQNMLIGLQASQMIFHRSFLYSKKSSQSFNELKELKLKSKEEQVLSDVTTKYFDLIDLYSNKSIINQNLNRLIRLQKILAEQLEGGLIEPDKLEKFNLEILNLQNKLVNLEQGIKLQKDNLKVALGMNLKDDLAVDYDTLYFDELEARLNIEPEELPAISKLFQKRLSLMDIKRDRIISDYFPAASLYTSLNYQYQADDLSIFQDGWFPNHQVGIKLDLPIISGFEKKHKIYKNQLEEDRIKIEKEKVDQQLKLRMEKSRHGYKSAKTDIDHQSARVIFAGNVLRKTQAKYDNDQVSKVAVIESEHEFLVEQIELRKLVSKKHQALLKLLIANGEAHKLLK